MPEPLRGAYVERLSVAPVKSLAMQHPDAIALGPLGVHEDRRFFLVDDQGRLVNGVRHGTLVRARAAFDGAQLRIDRACARIFFGAPNHRERLPAAA